MKGRLCFALSLLLVCSWGHAENGLANAVDNVMQWPVIGAVYPNLSPETGWAGGLGVQGQWRMPDEKIPSWLRLTGSYTQYRQWYIHMEGIWYMGGKTPWLLRYNFQYRDYPDWYYGIGNTTFVSAATPYNSRRLDFRIEPMFRLPNHWNVGPMMEFLWEKTNLPDLNEADSWKKNALMWGLGFTSQLDTRDGKHYPTKGTLLDLRGFYCEPYLGADCRLVKVDADFRHYVTLWQPPQYNSNFDRINRALIFAYQVRLQAAFSGASPAGTPFQMLPILGGETLMRGLRANMFRNNLLWAVQGELRFPIFSILRGTVFASVGDAYNTECWQASKPKVGYGVGLRMALNHDYVTVRFDVARNNLDNNWQNINSYSFYITASEAF